MINVSTQEQRPHWQLCPEAGRPIFSASLHHAHFDRPALTHAHDMNASDEWWMREITQRMEQEIL
ncbi:hypothetical protein DKT68_09900 [Micromonospora acroterricola]|uniref:Uncharacterized protein n=1 Tax=Micromonospora acroterricola TaxID=2202421 RepID=A0A317D618_9ACTN|nr:hypothetical protein DKT68_09900 [Micromonospora acroterricola]